MCLVQPLLPKSTEAASEVSSKLTFREGFQEDRSTYKRHDRCKEGMIQAAEKAVDESLSKC